MSRTRFEAGRGALRWVALAGSSVLLLAFTACGDGGGGGAEGGAEPSTVQVTLQEFAVIPDPAEVPAGQITFEVENTGPDDVHEFVVIKTDLAPDALPTDADGVVDETGEGIEVIDEIEDIPVGDTPSLTVDLEPGSYVLICNISEEHEGELEVHYQLGMRASLVVE